jgi:hypothetical protein
MKTTSEPVITVGTISAAVAAIIALLVAFGVSLDDTQQKAILGVVAVIGPIVASVISRGYVTPVAKAQSQIDKAAKTGTAPDIA